MDFEFREFVAIQIIMEYIPVISVLIILLMSCLVSKNRLYFVCMFNGFHDLFAGIHGRRLQ